MSDPARCQHGHIDNETWQCTECATRMVSQQSDAETILSAPNLLACTNPACSGDIDDSNCNNPTGAYIPDYHHEQVIVIGWKYTYKCDRCWTNGDTVFRRDTTIWGCGNRHHGDYEPIP